MRYLLAVLCAVAVMVTQFFYGGAMRPVFALPGLLLVGLAGVLGLVAICWRSLPAPSVAGVLSVLALAGWLVWRELESPDAWLAGGYLRLTLGCLVMFLLFAGVITNPFHRLTFLTVLFVAAVFQAALAAWQFARPEPLLPWFSEQLRLWYTPSSYTPSWSKRGHGTYLNGNHLVWFLNAASVMALTLTCWGRWGLKMKILCLYVALASLAGSVVTLSRGGFLGLAAGVVVLLLLSAFALVVGARDRRIVAILAVLAVGVGVAAVTFLIFKNSLVVQERFDILVKDTYRPTVFKAVLRQAQLEPLLGTGAGTFLYYGRTFREMASFSDDIFAHNDWWQIAADFGFPALALVILVVWVHATVGLRSLKEVLRQRMAVHARPQSHAAAILMGALACLAIFAVHSYFDFNMQIPANALLAAAFLGMVANSGMDLHDKKRRFPGFLRRSGCLLAAGAGAWLMILAFRAALPEYLWLEAENAQLEGRLVDASLAAQAGLQAGPTSRLERLSGEIYLGAALQESRPRERAKWARIASEHLEKSVLLSPQDAVCRLRLAEALQQSGRRTAASAHAVEVIRTSPTRARAYELYGTLLEEEGRLAEARQVYLVAAMLPGNIEARKRADAVSKKLLILSP